MNDRNLDRVRIQAHIDAIQYHLYKIEAECGTWYTETEAYEKFDGTAHRHKIVFNDVWGTHVATIGE